jgi:hypothetical protein
MEKQKHALQIWWPVYATVLVMIGLLALAYYVAPSPGWRTFLDIGVLVIGMGLIMMWLESHPTELLYQPPAEVGSSTVKSSQVETPAYVQYEFYVASDPPLIYGGPDHSTGQPRLNGYDHLTNPISFSPGNVGESFSNS